MSDLISRQALCEYALNQKDKSVTPNDIMRFPSAQPYSEADIQKMQDLEQAEIQKAYELGKLDAEPKWIPCSEMMPVSDGIYIVDDYRHGKHWIHTVGYMKRSNSWCEQHGIYYDDKYGRYDWRD